ncbi:MAG: lipopolysaccharide heptosyltransferase family protein [Xanthomonadaceae bacterium]|nr:lipopolysaccharide heptosyltransferase family protein [Xanthomonadaceae bacterium]
MTANRHRYSEMRRRIIRSALMPLFRTSDTRLRQTRDLSGAAVRRILICRPNHRLGNLLLLTPLVTELQRVFPGAKVDMVLAGDDGAELFGAFDNVKHIYGLSRRMIRHPVTLVRTALRIRRAGYDLAIDPCEASQSSRLLVTLANARYVIGLPRDGSFVDQGEHAAMLRAPRHMAQWPVYLLRRVATRRPPDSDRDFPELNIRLSADERKQAREVLDNLLRVHAGPQPRLIIGLFAEATGEKRYPLDWWQRFIAEVRVRHPDCALVEILPPDGRPRLSMDLPTFSSRSPRKVAAMISNMTCFVSADCGVMHLASASGTPTIGLFSVTDVSKYEPCGRGSRALVTNGKTPEEIARLASAHMENLHTATFSSSGQPIPRGDRKEHQSDTDLGPAVAFVDRQPTWPHA